MLSHEVLLMVLFFPSLELRIAAPSQVVVVLTEVEVEQIVLPMGMQVLAVDLSLLSSL
jgi:hypothetical protein